MAPQLMATNGGVAPLAGAPRREKVFPVDRLRRQLLAGAGFSFN